MMGAAEEGSAIKYRLSTPFDRFVDQVRTHVCPVSWWHSFTAAERRLSM